MDLRQDTEPEPSTVGNLYSFDEYLRWRESADYYADEISLPEKRPFLQHYDGNGHRVDRIVRPHQTEILEKEVFSEALFSDETLSAVSASEDERVVRIGGLELEGLLSLPEDPTGLVIFAHGSGSSRLSPRNTYVAERLQDVGLGTLLFDLLTEREARDRANVFDIPLLANRVEEAVRWARQELQTFSTGVFGSSTGAAAALIAAAHMPDDVSAVVSRGGRVDLANAVLDQVRAPSLFIVGGADYTVLELNEQAFRRLSCEKRLDVVPGATHLFEEPGALDEVIDSTAAWFKAHLGKET